MQVLISLLLVVLAIVGGADALYLTWQFRSPSEVYCGDNFDCAAVLDSAWASIGPVPISALGMIFYGLVFVLAVAHYLRFKPLPKILAYLPPTINQKWPWLSLTKPIELLLLVSGFGFVFSLGLVALMGLVIQAWCLLCLISAFTSTSIFLLTCSYLLKFGKKSSFLLKNISQQTLSFGYKYLLKPVFFTMQADSIHKKCLGLGQALGNYPLARKVVSILFNFSHPNLTTNYNNINFPSKVGLAAGFDHNGRLTQIAPDLSFGFHTVGTITLEPNPGNPPPRLDRLPDSSALLVNKGFRSQGVGAIIRRLAPLQFEIPVGLSVGSTNKHFSSLREQVIDIIKCLYLLEKSNIKHAYYELNISCPNTKGGQPFTTPKRLEKLMKAVDKLSLTRPVYVKMPIDKTPTQINQLLMVLDKSSMAGVIFGNLTKDKSNPDLKPHDLAKWQHSAGNVSGQPTWERSNKLIAYTRKKWGSRFTIIGTGGIMSAKQAQIKLDLGADLVQLITGMIFQGPTLPGQINLKLATPKLSNSK